MRGWPIALLGSVAVVAVVAIVAIVVATRSDGTSVFDLDVGDCFDLPVGGDDVGVDVVDLVDCAEPHEAEVVLTGRLNEDRDRPYPSDAELFAEIDGRCAGTGIVPDGFGIVPVAPNEASWEPLEGGFLCVAIPVGGRPVTGSITPGRRSD